MMHASVSIAQADVVYVVVSRIPARPACPVPGHHIGTVIQAEAILELEGIGADHGLNLTDHEAPQRG